MSDPSVPSSPPGWYTDQNGQQRWWDGSQWGDVAPPPVPPPVPPGVPAAVPAAVPYGYAQQPVGASEIEAEKGLATLAEALPILTGFLGPLIIYLIVKPEQRFAKHHAAEALNFSITLAIAYLICAALMLVLIGFVLIFFVLVGGIVFHIIAAVAANRGEWYRYPINLRLVSGAVTE